MRNFRSTGMAPLVLFALLLGVNGPAFAEIVFEHSATIGVGQEPADIAVADIDGDGDLDLLTANQSGDSFTILYNNGQGGFANKREIALPEGQRAPVTIAADDFNNDGLIDIAVGILSEIDAMTRQFIDPGVFIYLADSQGNYHETFYPVDGTPGLLIPVDLDGNGSKDIAMANLGYFDFTNIFNVSVEGAGVDLLFNEGDGTFSNHYLFETEGSVSPIELLDLDGDGDMDVLATNQGALNAWTGQLEGYNITIMENDAQGNLRIVQELTCSTFPFSATARDFDGDGDMDIIAAEQGIATLMGVVADTAGIGYWWGNGNMSFSNEVYVREQGVPTMIKAADLDKDGDQDFVLTNSGMDIVEGNPANPAVTVFENDGTGVFTRVITASVGDEPYGLALGDWDGDGATDIAVLSKGNNIVTLFKNKSPNAVPVRDWMVY